jgi:hypothetical protein
MHDHPVKGLITGSPQVSSKPGRPFAICQQGHSRKSNGITFQGDGVGPEAARFARDTPQFLTQPNRVARCHDDIADCGAFEVNQRLDAAAQWLPGAISDCQAIDPACGSKRRPRRMLLSSAAVFAPS